MLESHYQDIFNLITKDWKKKETDMMTLDNLIDLAEKQAREVLLFKKQRTLLATWALVNPKDELIIIMTPWENAQEKQRMVNNIRLEIKKQKIRAYSFVTEAWMAVLPKGEDIATTPRPSERPDKQEIVIALATDGKETKYRQWLIKRDWNDQIFDLELKPFVESQVAMESWLADLLK